ncbi:MAG TPA: ubiquinol-cytochrome c reductase iron-sulfur subunit [Thermoguttaceae bacterium]|nr:ubiquinol-cytochrome c reductase iron-sulfur subunit [Thermoguttaceae bacterium]
MGDEPESPERRTWLLGALSGAVGTTLAAIVYPIVSFLWPRESTESGAMNVVAPFKANQLPDSGGHWPPPFDFGGKPCLVIKTPGGEIRAFNAVCTHTDCTVQFQPDKGQFLCACHNGIYDLNGFNVSGPPPRPLETYKVDFRPTGTPGEEEIIVSRT